MYSLSLKALLVHCANWCWLLLGQKKTLNIIDLAPNVCGSIAQMTDHCTGIVEVTGLNTIET